MIEASGRLRHWPAQKTGAGVPSALQRERLPSAAEIDPSPHLSHWAALRTGAAVPSALERERLLFLSGYAASFFSAKNPARK